MSSLHGSQHQSCQNGLTAEMQRFADWENEARVPDLQREASAQNFALSCE